MEKDTLHKKKEQLFQNLKEMGTLLVAYSGGVDSTFLLAVAQEALGNSAEKVLAATAYSKTYPAREREEASAFTKERGIEHVLFESHEFGLQDFLSNPPERCYHCKKTLAQSLLKIAGDRGLKHVVHAANADDLKDYRPGMKAAQEAGMEAPLLDVELTKEEIRALSREMGLSTWNKPAMACLASRIPYGETITREKLKMVEDAENFLADKGFSQFRVRHHGPVARIEVEPSEIGRITDPGLKNEIVTKFKEIGFLHIAVDLEGYVTGSMNRSIDVDDS